MKGCFRVCVRAALIGAGEKVRHGAPSRNEGQGEQEPAKISAWKKEATSETASNRPDTLCEEIIDARDLLYPELSCRLAGNRSAVKLEGSRPQCVMH